MPFDMKAQPIAEMKEIYSPTSADYSGLVPRDSQWPAVDPFEPPSEKKLVRTIDWRILPLLGAIYWLQFTDKNILNYANVMNLEPDLHMGGKDFSWAGTAFFLGYLFAEFPQGALLQKFPVTKVLAVNVACWGVVTACTAAVQNSRQLLALRTLLGIFESVVTPSLILITSAWYKRCEGVPRFGIWFCGLGLGQIVGGLVSFAAQHTSNPKFQSWRLMFLVVGLLNMSISSFIWRLPSGPTDAPWLTPAQKSLAVQRLKDDNAGTGAKVLRKRSIIEAVLDLQSLFLCLITVLSAMSTGVVVYFSAVIIRDFGFSPKQTALLNIPSGAVAIASTLSVAFLVGKGYPRWLGMIIGASISTIGACLLSFSPANMKIMHLVGVYLVNAAPAVYTLVLSAISANYRGYTRKISGSAMVAIAFSFANIVSPQTFRPADAPNYMPAKLTLVISLMSAGFVAVALRLLYGYRNARADKYNEPAMSHHERNAVLFSSAGLDFADRTYRYSY